MKTGKNSNHHINYGLSVFLLGLDNPQLTTRKAIKMESICSLCKKPAFAGEFGHEEVIQEKIPRDHKGLSFYLILTHKKCEEDYNRACYDSLKPTLSRERGDIQEEQLERIYSPRIIKRELLTGDTEEDYADDFGREQQLDAWADSQESSHPFD